MSSFTHKRRRSPDLLSTVVLVVGMALSLTLVSQANAAARPVQPQLAGQCLTSLSVLDLRTQREHPVRASRQDSNRNCRRVTLEGLRMLGMWALSGRRSNGR